MAWFTIILQAFGFTPNGPLLGSFASWAQSLIGNVAPRSLFAIFQSAAMGGYGVEILGNFSVIQCRRRSISTSNTLIHNLETTYPNSIDLKQTASIELKSETTIMLPSVKSILLAEDEATNSTLQHVKENPGSILAMGLGAGMVIAPGLVVAPAISAAGFTTEGVSAGSLAAGIQSVTEEVASNSAFAICQSYATGGFGTAVIHGFVQGTGVGVGFGSIFSKWKHNVKHCQSECLDNANGSKADGSGQEDNSGLNQDKEIKTTYLLSIFLQTRKMQLLQNMTSTAMIITGTALVVAPAIVVGPALIAAGFGVGGVAAGSAAAGIQSGIGSVVAGSAFATLQSAGAGGAGLAIVNGVAQGTGAVVAATGLATKLKLKTKFQGQGDGHSANGDQEETDGTQEGNDAEEMVSKSKKN
ncbi:interferon-induced 6-16 [Fusarium phyllophilum]|uniref:Interferon-induced 6-16 n=1 Tax=Fusarium phyllophilum TaxID=47803 RepID=A0A8H5K866_9HYPO|nr:interferon-induced 6-16 [Fusarium phyllophilum]